MSATALAAYELDLAGSETGPATALILLLQQLRGLIADLPAPLYRTRQAPRVSGTIGAHVRHCLEHVAALVSTHDAGGLSYDRRQRGTATESDPDAAILEIDRLIEALDRLPGSQDRPIRVFSMLDRNGGDVAVRSTVAREVVFVVHHTIHHFAMIALLLHFAGWEAPAGFGLAPSTPTLH